MAARTAAGGRAAVALLAVAVTLALLAGLFLLVGGGLARRAAADSCTVPGLPAVEAGDTGGGAAAADGTTTRQQQVANARAIDKVARADGLPGRATLIALMTALQESALLNIDHGHLDSIGLFQQRPSQGWGTPEQIMRPEYSAGAFFGDGRKGLTGIRDWQSMGLGEAAQAVQRSAFPDLYDGQEGAARDIAREAGIDLGRAGTASAQDADGDDADDADGTDDGGTSAAADGCSAAAVDDTPGAPFHDGKSSWPDVVANPRDTRGAAAWARREAASGGNEWYQACLAFVAQTYGWNYSGVQYAIDHYREMPAAMRHDKDRNPPPGALMYWDTGQRAGHVALYLGDGKIASNDILRPGYIDVVPAGEIESRWGATYEGWAPPYFPKGG